MPRTFRQRLTAALGQLFDATNPREIYQRPFEPPVVRPVTEEVSPQDRERLMSDSRRLYANLGPCKGGIDDKAMYAVGRAWLPRFEGADTAWGREARAWLLNEFYPLAEISGQDFQTALYLLSVSIDRDGDAGAVLTEYETGFPAIQLVGAESIGTRDWKTEGKPLKDGPYRSLVLRDGVVVNEQGRAVAYRLKAVADDSDPAAWLSARDLAWVFDSNWIGAVRGVPGFASSILDLRDLRTVQGYEKMASALASSIGLLEYNETGLADANDPANLGSIAAGPGNVNVQEILGGLVKHYKAGTGQKLEAFKNDRPGDAWQRFMDRLLRNAFTGISWPYELAWDISALGGANSRIIVGKAMRSVEDRQDLLRPFAKRAVGYACAKAIKKGILPASADWWRWGFTMPARLTADYGRDAAAQREDYLNGIINLSDICEERGKDIDQHIATRAEENAKLLAAGLPVPMSKEQAQAQAAEKSGEDDRAAMAALEARHAQTVAALAAPQPAPSVSISQPAINIAPPSVTLHPAITVQAAPAPHVTVAPAEIRLEAPITVQPAEVNVSPPVVNVTVAPAEVRLEQAAAPAPVVNIENHVEIPPLNAAVSIRRDADGNLRGKITDTPPPSA